MKPSDFHLRVAQTWASRTASVREGGVFCGYETRTDPAAYDWDGLKRGGDPKHPNVIIQFCLDGFGHYADAAGVKRVTPGMVFAAVVPGSHRYYLPHDSPAWTFFWLIVRYPNMAERIIVAQKSAGAVLSPGFDSPFATRMFQLFTSICRGSFRDQYACEDQAFGLTMEWLREAHQAAFPQEPRETLLAQVRAFILDRIDQPVDVEDLGQSWGMSRSHFGHFFKAKTGLSPGQFLTEVRLQEVTARLVHADDKLDTIARQTGFADANHLCKVFRRHLRMTPGTYRKQMR